MNYIPPKGPPQKPAPKLFPILGEENIRKLLYYHYKNLSKSEISHLFPKKEEELRLAADKNADFFIQVLGGPPYFSQKYGPPMMRARHGKFPITYEARKIWLESFFKAIEQLKKELDPNIPFDDEKEKSFKEFLISFSEWMVNTN
jgi:hemoglobin